MATAAFDRFDGKSFDELIEQLRDYISTIQRPQANDIAWSMQVRERGVGLSDRVTGALRVMDLASLGAVGDRLRAYTELLGQSPNGALLKSRAKQAARAYEELLLDLKRRRIAHAEARSLSRQLKPVNYARNAFHAVMGISAGSLYHFLLTREQALIILTSVFMLFATLEITRRLSVRWNEFLVDRLFGAISRPSERYRVNSATIYLVALMLITALMPQRAVEVAVLVLGLADPAASLVGKRWGRRRLFRDKSVVGSLTFLAVGLITVLLWLTLTNPAVPMNRAIAVSFVVAIAGAAAELLSSRLDDNFSIPVVCSAVSALLL